MRNKVTNREIIIKLAESLLWKPYIWSGDDPNEGFDCSGMMVELLKSVGRLTYNGDWSAQGLYELFKTKEISNTSLYKPGCLVFYNNPITHVELIYDVLASGMVLTIGAMGGGSTTLTIQDAIKQDAYIKIRPIKSNYSHVVDPFN